MKFFVSFLYEIKDVIVMKFTQIKYLSCFKINGKLFFHKSDANYSQSTDDIFEATQFDTIQQATKPPRMPIKLTITYEI